MNDESTQKRAAARKLDRSYTASPDSVTKQGSQRGGAGADLAGELPVVIGIGASAGGLAALTVLLGKIPERPNVAFVVVMHLSPEHESRLAQLLQPSCRIPVQQVTEKIALKPNNVYIIPPGRNLSSIDSHLRLDPLEEPRKDRAPIDHFMRTLAASHEGNAFGIILTGTGSDGTLGAQEIKGRGGLVVVQEPSEAEHDGMPRSAIATGAADLVLPLEKIVERVLGVVRTQPRIPLSEPVAEAYAEARPLLQRILSLIHLRVGRDFSRYKQSTIMRRIRRRMQLAHIEELGDYLRRLQLDSDEVTALANDFLITVTSFFRDSAVFEQIEQQVVPELFKDKSAPDYLRIWSVGCSTGEEAYSLAMLLQEEASRHASPPTIQIFASDLQEQALIRARAGLYPEDIEADVTPERLERFFQADNGSYRVRKELRDALIFAPHNLLVDPPFSKVDLILCRNVLIYFQRNLQPDIIELFYYALRPNGWLILGTAESTDNSELFTIEDKLNGLYRKRHRPTSELGLSPFSFSRTRMLEAPNNTYQLNEYVTFGSIHHQMVERYAPPSILVNQNNKVVHISERAGRYMLQPGGAPTTSATKLVRKELQIELQAALQLAREKGETHTSKPVALNLDGDTRPVTIKALPSQEDEGDALVLVIFEEREPSPSVGQAVEQKGSEDAANIPMHELEIELALTKRRLQAAVEEYETSQEEMRAYNEELQSANEELRSTLEELETSKEELQSINEELQAANEENRHKVGELSQLSDDLQHLMAATHIATLFLDRDLHILRFTPQIGELFNLRAMDRGRPLSDLTHRLGYGKLMEDAAQVMANLSPMEREVRDSNDQWYLARMRPYRTAADRIEGVVLTFVDITARKHSEEALRQSEERYRTLFNAMDEGFCVVEEIKGASGETTDYRVLETNPAFATFTGLKNAKDQPLGELNPDHKTFWAEVCSRLGSQGRLARFECNPPIFKSWFEVCVFRLPDSRGPHIAILLKDISERKRTERALRESAKRDAFRIALADAVRSSFEPEEIRSASCRLLRLHLEVDCVAHQPLNNEYAQIDSSQRADSFCRFHPWHDNHEVLAQLSAGRPVIAGDALAFAKFSPAQRDECRVSGLRSYVGVPIRQEGRLMAIFGVHHSEPRAWKDSEISLIEEVAERTWASAERARTELALRQREAALCNADRRKDEFLAVLSHELRNPLTPITNSLHIIEEAPAGSEQAKVAQGVIHRQVGLLARLVNDLLDLTRVARGKVQLVGDDLVLNSLVARTVDDHRSMFERMGVRLDVDLPSEPVTIHGDANRLVQAIGNILQNAAKFTSRGGHAHVSLTTDDQQRALVRISDSGVGMAPEVVAQLFQPFMQGESTLDRSKGGLGLGLALSKRLIELHGGEISAHSLGTEQGAEFVISLPLLQPGQAMPKRALEASKPNKPGRILIIEDNVDAAETLGQVLQYHQHEVAIAHDGPQGLTLARKFQPEIVLCDIGLPQMNGFTVAKEFRADDQLKHVFMIALSGYAMPEDRLRALAAGFNHHVAKPPDLDHLQKLFDEATVPNAMAE